MTKLINLEIDQEHYHTIEIDTNEKDIVQIWQINKVEANVIQIERGKIQELIDLLEHEKDNQQLTSSNKQP